MYLLWYTVSGSYEGSDVSSLVYCIWDLWKVGSITVVIVCRIGQNKMADGGYEKR
jgi:hypothetical protein